MDGASAEETVIAACRMNNVDLLEKPVTEQVGNELNFLNTARDPLGNGCLHVCAQYGSVECLDWLLDIEGLDVNIPNTMNHDTPLHVAVQYCLKDKVISLHMVEMLMEVGANPLLLNKDRYRPIDLVPGDFRSEFAPVLEAHTITKQFADDIVVDDDDEGSEGSGDSGDESD
ncbi:hypothetical protein SJAG_02857 [Schizosaccharomyces japonicus yFS275]|uniref:Uncharacterized protein n=1 Tax=Schizosaccharomyces japonicus (strain yFS275 / FY16936) TaxID=402676 RepID=B6K1D2_SCHJY|nr:hypothetical protein SJAG_02857 [Schizosaccharomyces japonicus yFS275]EEB07753.1 hypothetical protein SJAG_02857 [Schizosaccharomyces japonicus yFS275]